jgi:hypothetical protein
MVNVKKRMEQGWRIHHVQGKETEILFKKKIKKKKKLWFFMYTPQD